MNDQRKKIFSGLLWRFAERAGAQGVKLLVEIILARLLLPDDYGLIALVTVFIHILNVFVDSGLGNALIQKKDADDADFSTVFWFNILWCLFLYSLLFMAAPLIAKFYKREELIPVVRVLGIQIILSGIKNVEQAYVSRMMQFRRFFFATLGGTVVAACIGIFAAFHGLGVWALVIQQLVNTLVDTVILWITVKWRPKRIFSVKRLKRLLSFGWKLLAGNLLDTVYTELRALIIGRVYSSADLGLYNRGEQFPHLFVSNVNAAIDSVLLPVMSLEQDNRQKIRSMTRRAIQISTYIMAPCMMGLAFIGVPLVRLILTKKWIMCVPYLRIFCITFMFYPIHTANLNAIKAMGRSDLFLKLEIEKKIAGTIALLLTMRISVKAMACSLLATGVWSLIINTGPNKRLLGYSCWEQMKDVLPSIGLAVFMGVCIMCIQFIGLPDIVTVPLQILAGILIYIAGSVLLKFDSFYYVLALIKSYRRY